MRAAHLAEPADQRAAAIEGSDEWKTANETITVRASVLQWSPLYKGEGINVAAGLTSERAALAVVMQKRLAPELFDALTEPMRRFVDASLFGTASGALARRLLAHDGEACSKSPLRERPPASDRERGTPTPVAGPASAVVSARPRLMFGRGGRPGPVVEVAPRFRGTGGVGVQADMSLHGCGQGADPAAALVA